MNLEHIIGQLFLVGFQGATIPDNHPIVADIRDRNLGGVILFEKLLGKKLNDNNIIGAGQVRRLTARLREIAKGHLLIAVDQEGGKVCRFSRGRGFPATASAAELGAGDDIVRTGIHALATADMLRELGINLNLAPVVDLNVRPDNPIIGTPGRSFSADPARVVAHAASWVRAHRSRGVLTCLKHFPGHGSSREDSHLGFVDISATWHEMELEPFARLIDSGLADAVMTGHLFNSRLDSTHPATLSHATITGLLREHLHFDGAVLTDDLQMKAITDRYGLDEAICMALSAGVDIMVIGNNLEYDQEILQKAVAAVVGGVKSGRLRKETIIAAHERVRRLKEKYR